MFPVTAVGIAAVVLFATVVVAALVLVQCNVVVAVPFAVVLFILFVLHVGVELLL